MTEENKKHLEKFREFVNSIDNVLIQNDIGIYVDSFEGWLESQSPEVDWSKAPEGTRQYIKDKDGCAWVKDERGLVLLGEEFTFDGSGLGDVGVDFDLAPDFGFPEGTCIRRPEDE